MAYVAVNVALFIAQAFKYRDGNTISYILARASGIYF